ncbi:hypothetical protein AG0111_0g8816 [Alternaria gaisen]|uniref:Uncharacterized protein n=1 Tax=Alternaria gaisen TaxID=167740 RepID=A0ACB6FE59_9PLEO|nr:hypothetical protein AG0111_0g8816 [Alternaria gaisen]
MQTQIWKDTVTAISHLQPAVASDAPNPVAGNHIREGTICSSISVGSMDDVLFFQDVMAMLDGYEAAYESFPFEWTSYANDPEFLPFDPWFPNTFPAARGALTYEDEVTPIFCTPPYRLASSDPLLPGFEEEVIPTFRTPPPFFECTVPDCRGHEDKVIPTFRGHPTDKPSVPLCFRTRHKPCIHRCGIG